MCARASEIVGGPVCGVYHEGGADKFVFGEGCGKGPHVEGVAVVVVELESCGGPSSDYGASGVVVNGVLVVLAPEEACAVGFLPNRDAVHHLLRMVCKHVSPILGASSVMMLLKLLWHLVVWILGQPAIFHLASCERSRSVVLWVDAVLSVLWMCLCVCFFHLWWSSRATGSCEFRVMCCRMVKLVMCFVP